MDNLTNQELLHEYAHRRSEKAFAELLRRHVDLVYSAALRMVCDAHLAEDVTQGVFLALAQSANQLMNRPVLSGWLHRTAQNIAAQTVRTDVRRRAREQKAAVMNELLSTQPDATWEDVAPHLDAALGELSEADRDVLLLRYFECKSAREMAQTLGLTDAAAQKRVNRAVERLRERFVQRGVTISASGLIMIISSNAVQAAPLGLTAAISTATTLAGVTIATAPIPTATTAIATTAVQKLLVGTVVIATILTPVLVQYRGQIKLAEQERLLQQQADQLAELKRENARLANLIAEAENARSLPSSQLSELLRLRGQVSLLNRDVQELTRLKAANSAAQTNVLAAAATVWSERAEQLKQWLEANPEGRIPELQFLTDQDWIEAVHPLTLSSDEEYRRAMSLARANAEVRVVDVLHGALREFGRANAGDFPGKLSQLAPYFRMPLDDAILDRYEIVRADTLVRELQAGGDWVITQKAPVDAEWDMRLSIGMTSGAGADSTVTNRWVKTR